MGKVVRRAKVVWEGTLAEGNGALTVGSGLLGKNSAPVTFATRVEQPEGQTSPEALMALAHAACYAMALSKTLAENGASPDWLAVDAACALDDEALEITVMDLGVRGDASGIGDEEFQSAAQEAEQLCPLLNALRGNVEVRFSASAAAA